MPSEPMTPAQTEGQRLHAETPAVVRNAEMIVWAAFLRKATGGSPTLTDEEKEQLSAATPDLREFYRRETQEQRVARTEAFIETLPGDRKPAVAPKPDVRDWLADLPDFSERMPDKVTPYVPDQVVLEMVALELFGLIQKAHELRPKLKPRALASLEYELANMAETLSRVNWIADPSQYEVWRQPLTGARFAVRLLEGKVTGCQALPHAGGWTWLRMTELRYDQPELAEWAARHQGEFEVEPPVEEPDEDDAGDE